MKKLISLFLVFVMVLAILPIDTVFAYPTPERISFPSDESLFQRCIFNTEATAGSGTTFRTIGWRIKYRLNSSDTWKTVNIDVKPDSSLKLAYELWLTKAGYEKNIGLENTSSTERVMTSIESKVPASDKQAYSKVMKNGGEWEFNAIIQVYINNVAQAGKTADTLDKALGLADWGDNTIDDFHRWYYLRPGKSDPEPPEAFSEVKAHFTINYSNNNITDNQTDPLLKSFSKILVLQDESIPGSVTDPISARTWYYWDVTTGYKPLASMPGVSFNSDNTTVTIADYDTLPNTSSISKAFKLLVQSQTDSTDFISHTAYFKYGSVTSSYKDVDTNISLYPDDKYNNLIAGPQSIPGKAAPKDYTLLTASPMTVTLDQKNSDMPAVFFYKKNLVAGTGTIVVSFKDADDKTDIQPPDASRTNVAYGQYTITAPEISGFTFVQSMTSSPQVVVLDSTHSFIAITFYYKKVGQGGDKPPIAVITGPSERMAGENVYFSGASSVVFNGKTIVSYIWDIPGAHITGNTGKNATVWYPEPGEYDLFLTVIDSAGLEGSCMTSIKITPPVPTSKLEVSGILKENRKVTASGANSYSPAHYPINKYGWSFSDASNMRYQGTISTATQAFDTLFKMPKQYTTNLRVENTYGLSASDAKTFTIAPDVAPVADFAVATQVLRSPTDSNNSTITVTNLSRSTDGDPIKKTVLFYAYDSDNDGDFTDETWCMSKDGTTWTASGLAYSQLNNLDLYNLSGAGNPTNFVLKTKNVGKYKFEAKTIEDIPAADTIPALLTAADYKTGITTLKPDSQKLVEVINTAPTVSFEVKKKKPVDIVVITDYSGTKLTGLISQENVTKASLGALNVDVNFINVSDTKKMGTLSDKLRWFRRYGHFSWVGDYQYWSPNYSGYNENSHGQTDVLWEEVQGYDSNTAGLPLRNPQNVSYTLGSSRSSSSGSSYREYYPITIRCTNDIKTIDSSMSLTYTNQQSNGGGMWSNLHGYSASVDSSFTPEEVINDITKDFYTIDFSQLNSITLRQGSDRYALMVTDNSTKSFINDWGGYFPFSGMTDDTLQYLKSNNFRTYMVAPNTALDTWISGERVLDIASTGYFSFYKTLDGKTKSLGTMYTTSAYAADRGNFGDILDGTSYANYSTNENYVIMKDGTVKRQSGLNDNFTTVPGLTNIVRADGTNFIDANNTLYSSTGTVIATNFKANISGMSTWGRDDYYGNEYSFQAFLKTDGTIVAIRNNETNGTTTTVPVYQESYNSTTDRYSYSAMAGVKEVSQGYMLLNNGNVIYKPNLNYDSTANRAYLSYYNFQNVVASGVSKLWDCNNFVIFQAADGTDRVMYTESYFTGRYNKNDEPIYSTRTVGPITTSYSNITNTYQIQGNSWYGNYDTLLLSGNGNLYYFSASADSSRNGGSTNCSPQNLLLVMTDVKYCDGRIAQTTDGKVYAITNGSSSSYLPGTFGKTLLNIPNVTKIVTKYFQPMNTYYTVQDYISYFITKDHELYAYGNSPYGQAGIFQTLTSGPVVPTKSNGTLLQPDLKYITLRDIYNSSPNNKVFGQGQYVQALTDIAGQYTADPSYSTNYVVLGDTVNYNVIYQDYENDPKYREYWTYNHESNYFENSLGVASYHGQTLSAPVTTFDKVGKFTINLKVRDNPKADDRFDNYRLYNQGVVTATLYVHRLPIPVIKPVVTPNGSYWKVEAKDGGSYDLDHLSRADKGIVASEWRWREALDINWHNERMVKTDCLPSETYYIQLRVKDLEGFWSDWKNVTIDNDNPPVAQFRIDNKLMKLTDTLKVLDQSYVQSFTTLTQWQWVVKKLNADGSVPGTSLQDAKFSSSNNGTGALVGYDTNIKTSYSSNGVGSYRAYLRVKDGNGMWSDGGTDAGYILANLYSQDFNIDAPPTARFSIDKSLMKTNETMKLKDTSYITGTSPIVKWHWIIKKLNPNGMVPSTNIQDAQFTNSNGGTGGYDVNVKTSFTDTGAGTYRVYLRVMNGNGMWSDGGTDSSYNLNNFYSSDLNVDNPPVAQFVIANNPFKDNELLKLKDTSYITGASPLDRWHWIVKKLNDDGSVPSANLQNATFTNSNNGTGALSGYDANVKTSYSAEGTGTYRIYLRVRNSNSMWSDGGTDSTYNLANMFSQDFTVQESYKLSNLRVVMVRDLHLESFYRDNTTGKYIDRPMNVNSMAVDASNFLGMVDGLTKGYVFEFEIDSANLNEAADTIVITPHFYTCDLYGRDPQERELYWENSDHEILKAGEGGHSKWAIVTLDRSNRTIINSINATWRGEYLIPGTAWAVPMGTSAANAKASDIKRDIIVNFSIKGYKNGVMKYDYNTQQWPVERSYAKSPYLIGDVIRYSWSKSNLDDITTIRNRP